MEPRTPPYNLEAEDAVLGAILIGKKAAIYEIMGNFGADDFYQESHRLLYQAMVDLVSSDIDIDPVLIGNLLKERNQYDKIKAGEIISRVINDVVTAANVSHYAGVVRDKAAVRRMIAAAQTVTSSGMANPEDTDDYLTESARLINEAMSHRIRPKDFLGAAENLNPVLSNIIESKKDANIIPTGYISIDSNYGGLVSPLLYLVAGRTSMGKSTFLLNLGMRIARASQKKVLYMSLEDSCEMQQQRMLSMFSGVPLIDILRSSLSDYDRSLIMDSTRHLQNLPLSFCSKRGLYAKDIRRLALSYQAEHGLNVLMVDHLGYIKGAPKEYDRNSYNIREMANLSGELGVPLILAHQMNREVEKRGEDKRPRLSDLRGSGTAEEDARAIWFVYRPWIYDKNASQNKFELIIAKASFGPRMTVDLQCDMPCYRIDDAPADKRKGGYAGY